MSNVPTAMMRLGATWVPVSAAPTTSTRAGRFVYVVPEHRLTCKPDKHIRVANGGKILTRFMCIHFLRLHVTIKYLSCSRLRHYVSRFLNYEWQHLFQTATFSYYADENSVESAKQVSSPGGSRGDERGCRAAPSVAGRLTCMYRQNSFVLFF